MCRLLLYRLKIIWHFLAQPTCVFRMISQQTEIFTSTAACDPNTQRSLWVFVLGIIRITRYNLDEIILQFCKGH